MVLYLLWQTAGLAFSTTNPQKEQKLGYFISHSDWHLIKIWKSLFNWRVTYCALNIKAISPEAIAAEAELAPNLSVQPVFVSAVICN